MASPTPAAAPVHLLHADAWGTLSIAVRAYIMQPADVAHCAWAHAGRNVTVCNICKVLSGDSTVWSALCYSNLNIVLNMKAFMCAHAKVIAVMSAGVRRLLEEFC